MCGNHQGAQALAYKLVRYGYYQPSMKKNTLDYIRKCDKCQKFGNIIHGPVEELTSICYLAPFEQQEVDILGPFSLTREQLKFVVGEMEYFIKWVKAEPLATISYLKLRSFVCKSIVYRFGIPKVLITNNGRQFDNSQFKSFCTNLKIDHRLTSISHPQSNGLAILTNQIILQNIRTWIKDAKGNWPEKLPYIVQAYRTSYKTETGEILFMLTFVLKGTIPIEVNLLTFTRLKPTSEELMIEHLDLLEEVRE